MGNSQPRYYNDKEAFEIIGKHTAERLFEQLNKNGKYIDFNLFYQIISIQFDRIPKQLCELLYYAFSSDLLGKVDLRIFIAGLAAIVGEPDHLTLLKFLFRVYSAPNSYELDRIRVEKILLLAYGSTIDKNAALKEINSLFGGQNYLPQKEFETFPHPLPILCGWIQAVLTIFTEDLPPRLASLDRRYSAALESEQMMARYGVPKSTCDQLRQVYYVRCSSNGSTRGELTEANWIDWTSRFLPQTLARIIYRSKLDPPLKTVWRFVDFAEYCMKFGCSNIEEMASTLCTIFQQQSHLINRLPVQGVNSEEENQIVDNSSHRDKKLKYTPLVSTLEMRRLFYLLSLPTAKYDLGDTLSLSQQNSSSTNSSLSILTSDDHELQTLHQCYGKHMNSTLLETLSNIEKLQSTDSSADVSLLSYVEIISKNSGYFPGLLWLSITACCVFGLQPASPTVEKEYITELMLWGETANRDSSNSQYGSVGTEWCLISMEWWLKWSYYVGRSNRDELLPPPIDNWLLLKKTSAVKQLLPNLEPDHDFKVVSPEVFHALQAWYGGGPKITRKVIPLPSSSPPSSPSSSQPNPGSATPSDSKAIPPIEFYPICVKLTYCDENGKYPDNPMTFEQMWSKYSKIEEVINEISLNKGYADQNKIRLWNIEQKHWKNHFILSNDLTFSQLAIYDGQILLIERQLNNGIWPKSQLHSHLEADEIRQLPSSSSPSSDSPIPSTKSTQLISSIQINNGRVGLDNLGNTCYMNASLQALLHTNFLNEYFLTKLYLRDINKSNKHGYGGRLANCYNNLVNDLWRSRQSDQIMGHAIAVMTDAMNAVTTSGNSPMKGQSQNSNGMLIGPSSVTPRKFRKEVGTLREQFAGDDQHDAQELLAFLLDGLSEDLNLVRSKPYIEQPDSDDRPDQVLADIWWENHLKRDVSAIQSIFTGQFKSITTCKHCEYNSARYEPFNMLSVPLPEESMRSLVIYVLTLSSKFSCCSVRVSKVGTLKDIIEEIKGYNLDGVEKDSLFLPVLMINYKIISFLSLLKSIDTIRDSDFLVFYQVTELPNTLVDIQKPLIGENGRYGKITVPSNEKMEIVSPQSESNERKEREKGEKGNKNQSQSPTNDQEQNSPLDPPEIEREISYDGDSDSGEDVKLPEENLETTPKNSLGEDFLHDIEGEIIGDGMQTENDSNKKKENTIEVVFIHRRVKFTSVGGIEMFKMEQIGLPIVEILPIHIAAVEVYSIISKRMTSHLKSSIPDLAKSNLLSVNVVGSPPSSTSRQKKNVSSLGANETSDVLLRSQSNLSIRSESVGPSRIRPIATEDAIGGSIPPYGFVLRYVNPIGEFCSRCHWLSRCEGCVIPYDDEDTILTFENGVTIAIDWHYVVYQEILDLQKSSEVIQHPSMKDHQSFHSKELPLERCLQKFTEEEPLDDMVCPKCHDDKCLKRSFALWRLPPVLIIQLKRFQFNNYSRRKLTNFVNFPLEGLDMTQFLAPSARFLYSNQDSNNNNNNTTSTNETKLNEIPTDTASSPSPSPSSPNSKIGTLYDLYSAVYHVGALGGGHYIATARDMSEHLSHVIASHDQELLSQQLNEQYPTSPVSSPKGGSFSTTSPQPPSPPTKRPSMTSSNPSQWWCYNDSSVTPVTSEKDIISPSAYVLFYIRKDIQYSRFQDIHCVPESILSLRSEQMNSSTNENNTHNSSDLEEKSSGVTATSLSMIGESVNEAKNKLTRLIPPNIATTRVYGGNVGGVENENDLSQGENGTPSENQDTCSIS